MFDDKSKDQKSNNSNNTEGKNLFGAPLQSTGLLFNNSSQTGSLFGGQTAGSLFTPSGSTPLKESEKKPGGLFGSIDTKKDPEAPKLNFPGLDKGKSNDPNNQNKSVPGMTPPQQPEFKKDSKPVDLFASSTNLFGGNNSGLFGSSGNSFAPKMQTSSTPQSSIFGSGNNTNPKAHEGLFANLSKRQAPKSLLTESTALSDPKESSKNEPFKLSAPAKSGLQFSSSQSGPKLGMNGLFSNNNENKEQKAETNQKDEQTKTNSLFGGSNQQPLSGSFFDQKASDTRSQPKSDSEKNAPRFSLTGNLTTAQNSSAVKDKPTTGENLFGTVNSLPLNNSPSFFGQRENKINESGSQNNSEKQQASSSLSNKNSDSGSGSAPNSKEISGNDNQSVNSEERSRSFFSSNQSQQTPRLGAGLPPQNKSPKETGNTPINSFQISTTPGQPTQLPTIPELVNDDSQVQGNPRKSEISNSQSSEIFGKSSNQKQMPPLFGNTHDQSTNKQSAGLFQSASSSQQSASFKVLQSGNVKPTDPLSTREQPQSSNSQPSEKNTETLQSKTSQTAPSNLLATFSNKQGASENKSATLNVQAQSESHKVSFSLSNGKPTESTGNGKENATLSQSNGSTLKETTMGRSKMAKESFFDHGFRDKRTEQEIITALELSKMLQEANKRTNQLESQAHCRLEKETLKKIEEWITVSFGRYNQEIDLKNLQREKLDDNEDINRFRNDVVARALVILNLPPTSQSIRLVDKIFDEVIDRLGVREFLFSNGTLNNTYFLKHQIYNFTKDSIELNLDSPELRLYIKSTLRKFVSNQLEFLDFIGSFSESMLRQPSGLFYHLLQYCLTFQHFRLSNLTENEFSEAIEDYEKKIVLRIVRTLNEFFEEYSLSLHVVKKEKLNELLKLLENFSYRDEQVIGLSLKVILTIFDLSSASPENKIHSDTLKILRESKSLELLPFRAILAGVGGNKQLNAASSKDLYRYIKGPEWLDWLEVYLNLDKEREIESTEAKYLIRILELPDIERLSQSSQSKESQYRHNIASKVLTRKKPIHKYIQALKEQNMLDVFYTILTALIHDYESYRKVDEAFLKQRGEFNYEFKYVAAEIANYPSQSFTEEIPFMEEKLLYFLKIIEVAPQKSLTLEKNLFEGPLLKIINRSEVESDNETGHKICHFVIDTINYYNSRSNQKIIAKCFRCITSLLSLLETHTAMKIALCINKPDMTFLNGKTTLRKEISAETNRLLQYFLHDQSFVNSVAVNFHDSSEQMTKMYPFRYSYAEYLPYVQNLIRKQEESETVIAFPSYWILKTLQGLSAEATPSLYSINIILEKLFILPSSGVEANDKGGRSSSWTPAIYNHYDNSIPRILLYLVEALNRVNLQEIIQSHLQYTVVKRQVQYNIKAQRKQTEYGLVNSKLEENAAENYYEIFLALRILKLLVGLYRLLEAFRDDYSHHFSVKLLSKIKYFDQLEKLLFNISSGGGSQQNGSNLVLSLVSFILARNDGLSAIPFINLKSRFEQEWVAGQKSVSLQLVEQFYRRNHKSINYENLTNFMAYNSAKYLECSESLQSLAIETLNSLIESPTMGSRGVSIMRHINYDILECPTDSKIIGSSWIIKDLEKSLQNILLSHQNPILKELAFEFILKSRSEQENKRIGSKVFYNYMSHAGGPESSTRLNALICKIICQELSSNPATFNQFISDKHLDKFLKQVISGIVAKDAFTVIQNFKGTRYDKMTFSQLERLLDEREIMDLTNGYDCMLSIVTVLIQKFFENKQPFSSIYHLNSLISKSGVLYLGSSIEPPTFESQLVLSHPRKAVRDPFELYVSEAKTPQYIYHCFEIYKQNICSYLSYFVHQLNAPLLKFVKLFLSIDRTLFGNQPIRAKANQPLQICCNMHNGEYQQSAVSLFGLTEKESIENVKMLYDYTLESLEEGMDHNQVDAFAILGYCLEWVRSRRPEASALVLHAMVKTSMKYNFWLNEESLEFTEVVKLLLSLVNIGLHSMSKSMLKQAKSAVIRCIHNHRRNPAKMNESVYQELVNVLLMLPLQASDSTVLADVVSKWAAETNNEYFYNQSRLLVELCGRHPREMVKFKPLTNCLRLKKIQPADDYASKMRCPESLSWVWCLKIATGLMSSSEDSIAVNEEVSSFLYAHKERIVRTLSESRNGSVTLGGLEQLEACLELLYSVVSNKTWVATHHQIFEEFTYLLSHKLVNLFSDYSTSRLKFLALSDLEKRFNRISYKTYDSEKSPGEYIDFISGANPSYERDSVFKFTMELKMLSCCKLFELLLGKCLQKSCFLQKYFKDQVWQNYRYSVSYWDRLNKTITDLIRHNCALVKKWSSYESLDQKLTLLDDCLSSAQFFVESGYLSSLMFRPTKGSELFREIYFTSLAGFELGTAHLILEQKFRYKYNSLMKSHIENYAKKLVFHCKAMSDHFRQQKDETQSCDFVSQDTFEEIQSNIQNQLRAAKV